MLAESVVLGDMRADGELSWLPRGPVWASDGSNWVWTGHVDDPPAALEEVAEKTLAVSEKDFILTALSNMLAGSSDKADEAYV